MSRHPRPVAGRRNPPIEYPSHVPTRFDPKDARVTFGKVFGWIMAAVLSSAAIIAFLLFVGRSAF